MVREGNVPPAPVSGCRRAAHHWIIRTPTDGGESVPGTCKHCGAVRDFRAGFRYPDEDAALSGG